MGNLDLSKIGEQYIPYIAQNNIAFFYKFYREKSLPRHQKRWFELLRKNFKYLLKLAPRDHGKTEVFTITYPLYRIINDRNIRILTIAKSSEQAQKDIGVVKAELEHNQKLRISWGDFVGEPWGTRAIYVKDRDYRIKDPTLEAVGVEGAITGGHFDLIVADDILDDENTKTESRRRGISNWFHGTIIQLAEPTTQVIVVGTRKHFDDLYSELMENNIWECDIESAIQKWPQKYEYIRDASGKVIDVAIEGDYEVLWAEKWDIKTLLLDRLATGSLLFAREKQNDPTSMRGNFLKLDWLSYYDATPPLAEMRIYQGVDLALSLEESADYFVVATIGIDRQNQIWLLDIYRDKLDFPSQGKVIENLAGSWKPISINIESNAYQAALSQNLRLTTKLPVRESNSSRDKITRFIAMSANFENGRVKIKRGLDIFTQEWGEFPSGKHDDTLDAVEKALEVALEYGELQLFI